MSDFIRREDAINAMSETLERVFPEHQQIAEKCINALPSSEQRWIPCSERMPEMPNEVLTTYIVNGNRKKRFVETATYYDGDEGFWSSPWDEYRVAGTRVEVIAWMPLPDPYEEEES